MPEPRLTQDAWLTAHPYLRGVADIQGLMDTAAAAIGVPIATVPDWELYRADFNAGIPLLQSDNTAIDLDVVDRAIERLQAELPTRPRRCVAAAVLSRYLSAIVPAFAKWRDEDRWMK